MSGTSSITSPVKSVHVDIVLVECARNAVRQRRKRGTLAGVKIDNGWLVDLTATDQQPTTDRPPASRPTNQATISTDQQPTIDLTPLVNHVAALEDQVQRLTEVTTMWQIRARQAEEQLLQLQSGPVAVDDTPEAPQDAPETMLTSGNVCDGCFGANDGVLSGLVITVRYGERLPIAKTR